MKKSPAYPFPLDETAREWMLACAKAYAKAHSIPLKTVGQRAIRDFKFFQRLETGNGGCTLKKADEVLIFFSGTWPDGAPWPKDVPRPAKALYQPAE